MLGRQFEVAVAQSAYPPARTPPGGNPGAGSPGTALGKNADGLARLGYDELNGCVRSRTKSFDRVCQGALLPTEFDVCGVRNCKPSSKKKVWGRCPWKPRSTLRSAPTVRIFWLTSRPSSRRRGNFPRRLIRRIGSGFLCVHNWPRKASFAKRFRLDSLPRFPGGRAFPNSFNRAC